MILESEPDGPDSNVCGHGDTTLAFDFHKIAGRVFLYLIAFYSAGHLQGRKTAAFCKRCLLKGSGNRLL